MRLAAGRRLRAPQDGAHPRQQLARVERLGQVVVGAELEPDDLVDVVALGGEHDDRRVGALGQRADAAADLEPVDAGEHDVEQHHVEVALLQRGQPALPVAGDGDVDLVLTEILGHERSELGVVVDEERGGPLVHERV